MYPIHSNCLLHLFLRIRIHSYPDLHLFCSTINTISIWIGKFNPPTIQLGWHQRWIQADVGNKAWIGCSIWCTGEDDHPEVMEYVPSPLSDSIPPQNAYRCSALSSGQVESCQKHSSPYLRCSTIDLHNSLQSQEHKHHHHFVHHPNVFCVPLIIWYPLQVLVDWRCTCLSSLTSISTVLISFKQDVSTVHRLHHFAYHQSNLPVCH